jgi:hypothetical protein
MQGDTSDYPKNKLWTNLSPIKGEKTWTIFTDKNIQVKYSPFELWAERSVMFLRHLEFMDWLVLVHKT